MLYDWHGCNATLGNRERVHGRLPAVAPLAVLGFFYFVV